MPLQPFSNKRPTDSYDKWLAKLDRQVTQTADKMRRERGADVLRNLGGRRPFSMVEAADLCDELASFAFKWGGVLRELTCPIRAARGGAPLDAQQAERLAALVQSGISSLNGVSRLTAAAEELSALLSGPVRAVLEGRPAEEWTAPAAAEEEDED